MTQESQLQSLEVDEPLLPTEARSSARKAPAGTLGKGRRATERGAKEKSCVDGAQ